MLPRNDRLRASGDFKRLYKEGSHLSRKHFVVYYKPNDRAKSRLGFSISKRYGGAVERNLARRRLGEAYKNSPWPKDGSYDIVIVVRPSAAKLDYHNMEKELVQVLRKIPEGRA